MSRKETALKYFNEQQEISDIRNKAGIELNRKGDAVINLKLADGTALPEDVTVEVEQTKHEFKFGANIFMLDEFECDEKNKIYREKFPEIFNLATVPFYWRDNEPTMGNTRYNADAPKIYRRPATDLCVDYCLANGVEPKLHCLNYDTWSPDWVRPMSVDKQKYYLEKRFAEIAERYADKIPMIEVTNETLQGGYMKFFFEDDFVEWSFKTADKYFHNNHLIINDYRIWEPQQTNRNYYFMQIERLLGQSVHLDSIGFQFHSFFPLANEPHAANARYNPASLNALMNNFAKLGKPQQITEMTIPAYGLSEEDEWVQAELTKNVYTNFFAHPNMEAIIYWNVVDGYAAFAPQGDMTKGENIYAGGLLRFDMSEKPVYKMLDQLINKEWHTSKTVKAQNGKAIFRGFYGDYKLTVHAGEKTYEKNITVSKHAANEQTIVLG